MSDAEPSLRSGAMLLGREPELRAIDRVLADARLGRSAALVIRGEAGIGGCGLRIQFPRRGSEMRTVVEILRSEDGRPAISGHHAARRCGRA